MVQFHFATLPKSVLNVNKQKKYETTDNVKGTYYDGTGFEKKGDVALVR